MSKSDEDAVAVQGLRTKGLVGRPSIANEGRLKEGSRGYEEGDFRWAKGLLVFAVAFAWFWFWRPYGHYGGDSEPIERSICRGDWIWKKEPLPIALHQLSYQIFSRRLGLPVGSAFSIVSCLAGAAGVLALWMAVQDFRRPWLTLSLVLCSGYILNFHGAIEVYAVPTAMIAWWILAIHKVEKREWSSFTIPLAFAATCASHIVGVLLFPSVLASAWVYRSRMTVRDRRVWLEIVLLVPLVYALVSFWVVHEGNIFQQPLYEVLNPIPNVESFLPLWSFKHLTIKGYFLWLCNGVALPFSVWRVWKDFRDPVVIQVGAIAGMTLVFLATFHPDLGYNDWDLFLFPSLPLAWLGAPVVAQSSKRFALSAAWIAAFLSVWIPRIPAWAQLPERGLAEVRILNYPTDARVRLDERYPIEKDRFWVGGGTHIISILRHGELIRWKGFTVQPGETIEIRLPEGRVPGPFLQQVQRMDEDGDN